MMSWLDGDSTLHLFAELLIDCEEDRTFQAVLVGMREAAVARPPSD
jgi:hypothetical protein